MLVVQTSAGLGMALSMATPSYLISNLVGKESKGKAKEKTEKQKRRKSTLALLASFNAFLFRFPECSSCFVILFLSFSSTANFLFDLWVLFSGYFLESKNIPPYFKWAEFSSFIKFANNAIVQSDFKDRYEEEPLALPRRWSYCVTFLRIFRCTAARACQFDATQLATITAPNGTNLGSTTVGQISVP